MKTIKTLLTREALKSKSQERLLGLALIVLGFLLWPYIKGCTGFKPVPSTSSNDSGLQDSENTKITIEKGRANIDKRGEKRRSVVVPREGRVTVTENTDGTVTIKVKNKGFCLSPGIAIVAHDTVVPALDIKLVYWGQIGAGVGVPVSKDWMMPYGAVFYQVSPASSVSVFGGYAVGGRIVGGLRLSFR